MKKLVQCLCIFALVAFATSASATTWTTANGVDTGTWGEAFNGHMGAVGSLISAGDLGQWNLASFTLVAPGPQPVGGGWYDTPYTGTLTLGTEASMWGTGGTVTGMTATNHSLFSDLGGGQETLQFIFTANGFLNGSPITFTASFSGDTTLGALGGNYHVSATEQGGSLKDISITVPDGGATLMLLGGALVGLGALRRKFRA